eukprot:SAG11_NODE_41355_length_194_cov_14.614583_1_plen_29_part_10
MYQTGQHNTNLHRSNVRVSHAIVSTTLEG